MTAGPLRVDVVERDRPSVTLRLAGDLAFDTSAQLLRAAERLLAEGYCRLRIDLAALRLCDSSGLSALIEVHHAARDAGGWMRPVGPSRPLLGLFARTGLDRVFLLDGTPVGDRATG
ncbi:STAS domain-containing protein [Plantactinospora sp. KBS50]|uniref:STAS domain-containing protein n=1 Tax=Plantactinospora sp. KBS50 TaxID=2024580 RepID=UPI0012FE3630|nr:STAS domain-containing protein [Plantactinospora sp. KBS50]